MSRAGTEPRPLLEAGREGGQPERFSLPHYVPYLLNRAGVEIAGAFTAYLRREHDLSLPAWRVLAALHACDDRPVGALAQATSIEVSTLSRLLKSMQRMRLVVRQRAGGDTGGDGRSVRILLTQAGRAKAAAIIPAALEIETRALRGFSAEEIERFKDLLRRFHSNMQRAEAAYPVADRSGCAAGREVQA